MPPVAVNAPVDGTKNNLVDVTFWGKLPVLAVTQVGYTDTAVAASFVIAMFVAFVTAVVPIAPTICAAVAAVKTDVPLP
jgi:hypothetical protein